MMNVDWSYSKRAAGLIHYDACKKTVEDKKLGLYFIIQDM